MPQPCSQRLTIPVLPLRAACVASGERRKRGKGDRRSQELGQVIGAALEQTIMTHLMPRSQIDIYVQARHLP